MRLWDLSSPLSGGTDLTTGLSGKSPLSSRKQLTLTFIPERYTKKGLLQLKTAFETLRAHIVVDQN